MKLQLVLIFLLCIVCNVYINRQIQAEKSSKYAIRNSLPKLPFQR